MATITKPEFLYLLIHPLDNIISHGNLKSVFCHLNQLIQTYHHLSVYCVYILAYTFVHKP